MGYVSSATPSGEGHHHHTALIEDFIIHGEFNKDAHGKSLRSNQEDQRAKPSRGKGTPRGAKPPEERNTKEDRSKGPRVHQVVYM
jgi:hypothetical protein